VNFENKIIIRQKFREAAQGIWYYMLAKPIELLAKYGDFQKKKAKNKKSAQILKKYLQIFLIKKSSKCDQFF
jgi:hypothetical protein